MKNILLLLTTLCCITASAQKIERFYDALWKPCPDKQARFYSRIIQTDSGWSRHDYFVRTAMLQMSGLYEDSSTKILNG